MKKISIIAPFLSGNGGTESVLGRVLSNSKLANNFKFSLYINGGIGDSSWIEKFNLSTKNIRMNRSNNKLFRLVELLRFLIECNSDVVICMTGKFVFIAWLIRILFNKHYKVFSWVHFSIFDEKNVSYKKLKFADRHLAISSGIIDQLKSIGIPESRCKLVFNPIEIVSENTKYDCRSTELIYIGRPELYGQKNLSDLFLALRGLNIKWHLTVYGSGSEIEDVIEYVEKMHLMDRVDFKGWVKDPWKKISSCKALLLTSKYEGFPMVILEALSHGVPVVSSDCPVGPKDMLEVGINGYLYQPGKIEDLKDYLAQVLLEKNNFNDKKIQSTVLKFSTHNFERRFIAALE